MKWNTFSTALYSSAVASVLKDVCFSHRLPAAFMFNLGIWPAYEQIASNVSLTELTWISSD